MNASDRLNTAHAAACEGRHEEALREYVWFHNHALDEQPSLYGVRLSFALSYWMELSENYPKAKDVLVEIRDKKSAVLLGGKADRELFHDVISINDVLGCPEDTHSLFVYFDANNRQFAESCAKLALPAIVAAGDFSLAIRYFPQPESRVVQLSESLNEDINDLKDFSKTRRTHIREAYIHNYASEVQLVASILRGLGQHQEASRLTTIAEKLVKNASVRKAVREALESTLRS